MQEESHRIDKWLWEVRLFKTRSMATDACKAGKVKLDGQNIKASREMKVGDVVVVSLNPLFKTVKITQFPKSRMGAKLISEYYEDLTPAEEYERIKLIESSHAEYRDRGTGRPTKKQRRVIDKIKNSKDAW